MNRAALLLFTSIVAACGGSRPPAPTTPTPAPTPPLAPDTFSLSGQITDSAIGSVISGAVVRMTYPCYPRCQSTTTDDLGNYNLAVILSGEFGVVSKSEYENDSRWFRHASAGPQHVNIRLHRIERLTAGESTVLTVEPDDPICFNDIQDFPGLGGEFVCRTVRIMVLNGGILTVEAVPTSPDTVLTGLEIQDADVADSSEEACCANVATVPVRAGREIMANVEMDASSTASHSFVVNTSLQPLGSQDNRLTTRASSR
jgi:hypothetical protein